MPKKVLLIRLSSLGDVVLTSALLEPLYGNSFEVHLLTFNPFGGVFKDDDRVKVIQTTKAEFKKNLKTLVERLNGENYFAILDLHSNLKSFLLRRKLRAEVKAVYDKRALFRRICVFLNRFGLAERLKRNTFSVVKAYAETLRVLGIKPEKPRPFIKVNETEVEKLLEKYDLKRGNFAVLGIGARYRKKEYSQFDKLAELLNRKGYKVVLIGDRRDYEKSKNWRGVVNLCGKLSLIESLRLLSAAKLFIGNDSGTSHMARAVKVPTAVIYGGTHPCLGFAPEPDEGIVITKNLPCSPCDLHGKGDCGRNLECLRIPPEEILEKVEAAFGGI